MDIRVFTSLFDEGEDQLANLIDDLRREAKDEAEHVNQEEEKPEVDRCDDILERLTRMHFAASGQSREVDSEPIEKKKKQCKKSKFQAPEYIISFDDLSSELKSRSLLSLLKFNRHLKQN